MGSEAIGEYVRGGSGQLSSRRSVWGMRRAKFRLVAFLGISLAGSLLAAASPTLAASPLSWASPIRADDQPPFASPAAITGVSCPSTGLCVAVDSVGNVLVSTDPTGGTGAWATTYAGENSTGVDSFTGVSCPSTSLCVAVDSEGDVVTSTNPAGGGSTWTRTEVVPRNAEGESDRLEAVSCPSESLCVVTDGRGDVVTSTDPTGGASAWIATHVESHQHGLGGVSCPSVRMCVAVASEGDLESSTDPAGGVGAWTEINVDGTGQDRQVLDVSCVSESLCVASDNSGDILTATEPTGGKNAWTAASVDGSGLIEYVSCASSGLCVALDDNEVITSIEPAGGASAWTPASISTSNKYGGDPSLDAAACPSLGLCVLGDDGSAVVSATEPTKDASAWTVSNLEIGSNALQGVSCVSEDLCVGVDNAGNVVTSTDPAAGPGTWTSAHVDGHGLSGVSCPSAGLCVAVDEAGDVVTSTDPTGGAGVWSVDNVDGTIRLRGISCASASLCVAIDSEGDIVTSADPTGGIGAWTVVRLYPGLSGVSCPSEQLCVLTASEGYVITSTEPAAGADTWSPKHVGANEQISCPSVSLCVTVNSGLAPIVTWGDPTSAVSPWSEAYIGNEGSFPPAVNGLDVVSCAAGGVCVATSEGGGNGSPGNVIASSDPAGGAQSWIESNVYGVPLKPPNPILPLGGVEMPGASCVPEGMCVVVDTHGGVMVGTPPPAVTPVNSSPPVVSGTPAPGQTLSCSNGSWTGYPPPTFTYQWLRDGTPIGGASTSAYVVQAADEGYGLVCQVTASNSAGSESATSNTLQVPPAQAPGGGGSGGSGGASGGGGDSPGTLTVTVSNAFVLNGMESVAGRGTVKVTLTLPGPGTLQIVGKASAAQLAGASRTKKKRETTRVIAQLCFTVSKAGRVVVTLVPSGSAKTIVVKRGKLKATVTITYTPNGGAPRSIMRTVTFRLKRRR
jgi:hypothetical protein